MDKQKIKAFFAAYEQRFNDSLRGQPIDVEGQMAAFADYIVGTNPVSTMGGKNDDTYRDFSLKNQDFYRNIGTKYMKVMDMEITELDDLHAAAKVYWDSGYEKDGKEINIRFYVIYLLSFAKNKIRIFAFITGDEEKVLRDHGLMPEEKS
jgi:hypothetical protein